MHPPLLARDFVNEPSSRARTAETVSAVTSGGAWRAPMARVT